MNRSISLKLLMLFGISVFAFGCATKGYVNKQISPVQSQLAVLTDEVAKIDESIQDLKSTGMSQTQMVPMEEPSYSGTPRMHAGGARTAGGIYRTPSGFELPSVDIQRALKAAGFYQGPIDGKIGPSTEASIREFQRANGLEADGICGQNTWSKLKAYLSTVK